MKRILMLCAAMFALVANAQSEQWKAYLDICGQFRADMTPCEKMEFYARMDSLFDGYIPLRRVEMNYMEAALQCGDTATFKRLAFRVVRWKGWNPLVFYYVDQYKFLKDCDWWPELDSIQQAVHSRKDYSYAETLHQMQQEDQAARRAFHNRSFTPAEEDSLGRRMRDVDSANLVKLKWLIDTLGFPSWDRVCSYGSADAWLVAQPMHPWFQYGYVKQLRQAVAASNCVKRGRTLMPTRQIWPTSKTGCAQSAGCHSSTARSSLPPARTTAPRGNAPSPTSRMSTCVADKCLCRHWRTISKAI